MPVNLTFPVVLPSIVFLHAGHGQDLALATYVYRVLLHLIAIGGIGVLIYWGVETVVPVRSSGGDEHDSETAPGTR